MAQSIYRRAALAAAIALSAGAAFAQEGTQDFPVPVLQSSFL